MLAAGGAALSNTNLLYVKNSHASFKLQVEKGVGSAAARMARGGLKVGEGADMDEANRVQEAVENEDRAEKAQIDRQVSLRTS